VDCAAYWTGERDLFSAEGTTRASELARYDTVTHLRTPTSSHAYNRDNPLRVESIEEAAAIDVQIAAEWSPPASARGGAAGGLSSQGGKSALTPEKRGPGVLPSPRATVLLGRRSEH
jgi:hypothetical protein